MTSCIPVGCAHPVLMVSDAQREFGHAQSPLCLVLQAPCDSQQGPASPDRCFPDYHLPLVPADTI